MPITLNPRLVLPLILALCIVFLADCANVAPQPQNKADWTTAGTGAFHTETGPIFQGVGSAEKMRQVSLLRATADNRAKIQLIGLLQQYVNALTQFVGIRTADLESRQAIRAIVQQSLQQASISEHWFDEDNNKIFSRCSITLETVKQIISSSPLKDAEKSELLSATDHVFEAFVSPP